MSDKKPLFPVPPPPPPKPGMPLDSNNTSFSSANSSTASNVSVSSGSLLLPRPPPPPTSIGAPPHFSTAPIPTLRSAPPSGNYEEFLPPTAAALPPPPQPPPRLARPPAPPPPPPPSMPSSPPPQPTIAPLPPPPSILKKDGSTSTIQTSASSVASTTAAASSAYQNMGGDGGGAIVVGTYVSMEDAPPSPSRAAAAAAAAHTTNPNWVREPDRLPNTTFVPKSLQILAQRQTHIPVLVIATEAAHKMAWKNQLRLVDLLQGLVQAVTTGNTSSSSSLPPFRSVSRSLNLQWHDLPIQFLDPEQLKNPMSDEEAQLILQTHAQLQDSDGNLQHELNLLEDQVDNLLQDDHNNGNDDDTNANMSMMDQYKERQRQLEQATQDAYKLTSPLHLPWLLRYRQALDVTTNGLQHDLLDCPAICLLVCTTQEQSHPIDTLRTLSSSHYLPHHCFHNGIFDPDSLRQEVLVLHDNVDGPDSVGGGWNETSLRQSLQRSFGPNASLVRMNSISLEAAARLAQEETTDLWSGGGTRGNCLSVSDRVVIRNYLATLITTSILPALERRISDLNVIVSDRKRGVRNVFKSLWRGGGSSTTTSKKDDDDPSSKDGEVKYRFDSAESQTRLLADTLFLVRDYDAALSMYRLIKDDFKHDKAMAHYAGVQEMMALCMYMMDPYARAKEIFSNIENALLSYSRAAEEERPAAIWGEKPGRPTTAAKATRLASRLSLVLTSTRNICDNRHLEVADLLASASSHETSLGAAVLLEQSSSHYFKAEMYRKYAFHMLMSGHMFRSAEQEHHAFRCFTSALYIYRDSRWEELHNHLRSALAAQLYSMERMAVSLQLYARLLGSADGGRVSSKSQQKFINHLLEICNENPKKALVGADRMAASSKLSGVRRDAVRQERLNRIVQVIRYTKSASRVLELPNIGLPAVDDSSVIVVADQHLQRRQERLASIGTAGHGKEEMWDDLVLEATAELKAMVGHDKVQKDDEMTSRLLSRIEDPVIRKVVGQVEREKKSRTLAERAKRSSTYKASPPVRSQMEPLTVEFFISNPLSIPIDLDELQLVARMTDEDGDQVCTNEDSIKITPLVSYDSKRTWTFNGSPVTFEVPHFCRVSKGGAGDPLKQSWKSADEVDPFFVVTKMNINMEPESRRMISASLCPLACGNLEILGVRCRLLDDVWVFHPFNVKGPLLQNTRSNRANRVRAESTLLKAKVERGMPCLVAELHSTSLPEKFECVALQGQVSTWMMVLTNVGTVPATNVYLKTSLPWIGIDESEPNDDDKKPRCGHIGASGTLLNVPLPRQEDGYQVLAPGQNIEVPIRIRTAGLGRQDIYMLFRYELFDSVPTGRYRFLRKMFEVPIYPSLSISASVQPSFDHPGELILSLELTNARTDRPDKLEILPDKVSLASRCFCLLPLLGQSGIEEEPYSLGWQERMTMHYRVASVDRHSNACFMSESSFSSTSDESPLKEAASTSKLDFFCIESAYENYNEILRSHERRLARAEASQGHESDQPRSIAQIRRANTIVSRGADSGGVNHPVSISRVCPSDRPEESINLVVSWQGSDSMTFGEHYFQDLSITPLSTAKVCPIAVTAKHPQSIFTNLSQGPADVPIEVTLRNRLVTEKVDFEFGLEHPDTFDFVGPEAFKSVLDAGEELSIPLRAMIPSTGVYNLQRITLTIDNEDKVTYQFPSQWMVTINEVTK